MNTMHRKASRFLASLAVVLTALAPHIVTAKEGERPNFIFFITDDQFKDMMNFMPEGEGKNLTPATDSLSSTATVMDNMYVTSPVCTPSRYACLTGKYPSRSQSQNFLNKQEEMDGQTVVEWNTFIRPEDKDTLPWRLKRGGYTNAFVGKNHVIEAKGIKHGAWDADPNDPEVKALLKRNAKILEEACAEAGFDYAASLYDNNPSHNGLKALIAHNQDWITQGAVDFIAQQEGAEKPFFMWVATTLPHGPSDDARSWKSDPRITAEGLLDEPIDLQPARETLQDRVKAAGVKGWQKENLLWMDDSLGVIVQKLADVGELDNTVIFYFNDHGQLSKGTVYQGGVHGEAFIWRKEPFPVGPRCNAYVSNVDFAPTILDMADIPYEADAFDGVSFLPALDGEVEQTRESLFFELGYVRGVLKDGWKYIALRYPDKVENMSLAERQRRLDAFNASQRRRGNNVYNEDPMAAFSHIQLIPGGGDAEHKSMSQYPAFYEADQLYYIPDDPREQVNLAGKSPEYEAKLAEMKLEMQRYLSELPGTFGELKPVQ